MLGGLVTLIVDAAASFFTMMLLTRALMRWLRISFITPLGQFILATTDPQKIREALTQTKDFEGSAGAITINAERNADKAAVFKTVKDGKFVFLTTVKP